MSRLLTAAAVALALAIPAAPAFASSMQSRRGPYEIQVLVQGQPARTFAQNGDTWILGQLGARYTLRVWNHSGRRIEAVVSVDGRDVIDGLPGDAQKRGYLVPAWGSVDIDGWRISQAQAAAFRFSSVENSYAAQTGSGREVGVIGVAVFEEKRLPPRPVAVVPREPPSECCSRRAEGYESPHAQSESMDAAKEKSAPMDSLASNAPSMQATQPRQSSDDKAPSASAPPPAPPMSMDSSVGGSASRSMNGMSAESAAPAKKQRAGLGTEYGEAVDSQIFEVQFERASRHPTQIIGCRYNDREGLIALGIDVDGTSEEAVRRSADPFPTVDRGFAAPPPSWNR